MGRALLVGLLVALLVALLVGCAGRRRAEPAPAHRDTSSEAPVVDRKLLAELAAGLEEVLGTMAQITAGADCATMGVELRRLFDRSRPLFDLARTQGAEPASAEVLTAEMDQRAARVRPLVDRIGQGLGRCRGDQSVVDAISTMPTF